MKKVLSLILVAVLALVSMSFAMAEEKSLIKVGFSESDYNGAWRVCEVADFKKTFTEENGYELIIADATSDIEKQMADVDDLIAQQCDIILIVPVDANAVAPAFNACKEAGIPVIDLDTQYLDGTWGEDFITTVRSDQFMQGEACAEWVMENFESGSVKVLEITGDPGRSDAQNRSNGFNQTLADAGFEYDHIQQNGEWSRATAQEIVSNVAMSADGDFNVIYTHADEMALGCILGLKQAGLVPNKDVFIVTVDGQFEALDAMVNNELAALITCSPRGAGLCKEIIEKYFAGEELEETYFVDQKTVTVDNVKELYDQVGF